MTKPKGIFWLASYPKSGNTWFRIFLANLLNNSSEPIDVNHIRTGAIASAREWVDQALGFDSAELSHDELDALRPAVYAWHSQEQTEVGYHKIHDAYTYVNKQQPLVPQQGCLGALYFVRNPLDVAISFANHSACSIDDAIAHMGDVHFAFCKGRFRQHTQLRQWLLSWSMHVNSWVNAENIPLLTLRYEDMKKYPQETFAKAVKFLRLDVTAQQIARALANSQIEKLQQMEEKSGFREKPRQMKRFFRKGIAGDWQTTLTQDQIQRIIQMHGEPCVHLGIWMRKEILCLISTVSIWF